jgi:hypothetical protein
LSHIGVQVAQSARLHKLRLTEEMPLSAEVAAARLAVSAADGDPPAFDLAPSRRRGGREVSRRSLHVEVAIVSAFLDPRRDPCRRRLELLGRQRDRKRQRRIALLHCP